MVATPKGTVALIVLLITHSFRTVHAFLQTNSPKLFPIQYQPIAHLPHPLTAKKKSRGKRKNAGFERKPSPVRKPSSLDDNESMKRTTRNLFSICSHIQDPELYSSRWADNASIPFSDDDGVESARRVQFIPDGPNPEVGIVADRDAEDGEILSLYPIHGIGLPNPEGPGAEREYLVYDTDKDGGYFSSDDVDQNSHGKHVVNVSWSRPLFGDIEMTVRVNPNRRESLPGWLGHLGIAVPDGNCLVVPLKGAEPFCALVSVGSISRGQQLLRTTIQIDDDNESDAVNKYADNTAKRYGAEIAELRSYLTMAYPQEDAPVQQPPPLTSTPDKFQYPFHKIKYDYSNLKVLHHDPDIYTIPNFLTESECDRLIAKAKHNLLPCVAKNEQTGVVEIDKTRTSTNANVPRSEVPSVVSKLVSLGICEENHLETLQILHYSRGQQFKPHTDGFTGPISACGFENSGRLVTVFCYLNDVQEGGSTRFTKLGLDIRPERGMAVVHLPTTSGFEEDLRTEHEGAVVTGTCEKWLLTTWIWKDSRINGIYSEENLPLLSDDII